ncbi:anaerobic sulfite reductase subunit AsrB [Lacrimispora sp. NSJ-141]|uniref:Anaerobic sulfite reductase subunit AsrB n=1 Tax=Lientehia hominis TaxID=2897778 RepID=A0AAP2RJQ3_9FIRM|nr:anaerobic sulfite reductase subunit AsrB [Lientehia hominis]MCD2493111.1 anaerobic sulfite reductase subunit AsrB [Lientehia hominis]
MKQNEYVPFLSEIIEVIRHTEIEYTFRMKYLGDVKPGQFFEVSIPKYGEAPISVSGIGDGTIDLTIRRVGKVTNEIFERYEGGRMLLRGPYGNGFCLDDYKGKELVIVAGGTGVSPVRGVMDHFACHMPEIQSLTMIAGFKSPSDILFRDDFSRWSQRARVILTVDSGGGTEYREGLVTAYIPGLFFTDLANAAAIVVGPPAMMRFSIQALKNRGLEDSQIWISLERKMCCGIGKCGHCRINDTYVCLDGPVFPYAKGRALID